MQFNRSPISNFSSSGLFILLASHYRALSRPSHELKPSSVQLLSCVTGIYLHATWVHSTNSALWRASKICFSRLVPKSANIGEKLVFLQSLSTPWGSACWGFFEIIFYAFIYKFLILPGSCLKV